MIDYSFKKRLATNFHPVHVPGSEVASDGGVKDQETNEIQGW